MEIRLPSCDHKCHAVGLNPWVEGCVVCGCPNTDFNAVIPAPESMAEICSWDRRDPADRPEKYRIPAVDALVALCPCICNGTEPLECPCCDGKKCPRHHAGGN